MKPALLSLLVLAGPIYANNDSDIFHFSLEELLQLTVFSASLFEETKQHAAASIEVIRAREWQKISARTNVDALSRFTGIQTYPTLFGGNAIAIRGYSQFLSVRGVATLIDGIPVNDLIFGSAQYSGEHTTLGVLDSLELVKGPGSTLYGSDAFHGVIQFNTFKTVNDLATIRVTAGDPEYFQADTRFSRQWIKNHYVNFTLDTRHQMREAWEYHSLNTMQIETRPYQYDKTTLNLKLHNGDAMGLRYLLSGHRYSMDGEGFVGGGEQFGYQENDLSDADLSTDIYSGDLSYNWDNSSVGLKTYHWLQQRDNSFEIGSGIFLQHQRIEKDSLQAYWRFNEGERRLYVGMEASRQDVKDSTTDVLTQEGVATGSNPQPEAGFVREISSLFFQGRLAVFSDKFEIEAGTRLDDYKEFGVQTTPRLALIFKRSDAEVFKAIYSSAFRAAVALEIFGSTAIKGSRDIRPEELSSYELIWFKQYQKVAHNLTLFYNDWHEGIVSLPIQDANYTAEFKNTGENKAWGLESEFKFSIKRWLFDFRASYIRSFNKLNNSEYTLFPKLTTYFSAQYRVTDELQSFADLIYKNGWDSGSDSRLGAYARLDLGTQYKVSQNLDLFLSIKNIFNKQNKVPSILGGENGELEPVNRAFDFKVKIRLY